MVIRIRIDLRQPNGLFAENRLAVYNGGNLAIGAACVKADAVAVQMLADCLRFFVCCRLICKIRHIDHLEGALVNLLHKVVVKRARAVRAVRFFDVSIDVLIAADVDFKAAPRPQQKFYQTVNVIVVRVRHLRRAVDKRVVYRNQTAASLHRDSNRFFRRFQKFAVEHMQRNKGRIKLRHVFDVNIYAINIHFDFSFFHRIVNKFYLL